MEKRVVRVMRQTSQGLDRAVGAGGDMAGSVSGDWAAVYSSVRARNESSDSDQMDDFDRIGDDEFMDVLGDDDDSPQLPPKKQRLFRLLLRQTTLSTTSIGNAMLYFIYNATYANVLVDLLVSFTLQKGQELIGLYVINDILFNSKKYRNGWKYKLAFEEKMEHLLRSLRSRSGLFNTLKTLVELWVPLIGEDSKVYLKILYDLKEPLPVSVESAKLEVTAPEKVIEVQRVKDHRQEVVKVQEEDLESEIEESIISKPILKAKPSILPKKLNVVILDQSRFEGVLPEPSFTPKTSEDVQQTAIVWDTQAAFVKLAYEEFRNYDFEQIIEPDPILDGVSIDLPVNDQMADQTRSPDHIETITSATFGDAELKRSNPPQSIKKEPDPPNEPEITDMFE